MARAHIGGGMNMDDVKALACVIALCIAAWIIHDVLPQSLPVDFRQAESGARL